MSQYTPDRWVILRVTPKRGETWYRLLGSWSGGYLHGDSWKMNSGITKVELVDDIFKIHGTSGSVYSGHKDSYGMTGYTSSVLMWLQDDYAHAGSILEVMPGDTDWTKVEWGLRIKPTMN